MVTWRFASNWCFWNHSFNAFDMILCFQNFVAFGHVVVPHGFFLHIHISVVPVSSSICTGIPGTLHTQYRHARGRLPKGIRLPRVLITDWPTVPNRYHAPSRVNNKCQATATHESEKVLNTKLYISGSSARIQTSVVSSSCICKYSGSVWPYNHDGLTVPVFMLSRSRRGLMLDVSRNRVHSLATLKYMANLLSALKMSQLQVCCHPDKCILTGDTGIIQPLAICDSH